MQAVGWRKQHFKKFSVHVIRNSIEIETFTDKMSVGHKFLVRSELKRGNMHARNYNEATICSNNCYTSSATIQWRIQDCPQGGRFLAQKNLITTLYAHPF